LENGDRSQRLIYDCASGSGSFLVEAARRIREESEYDENNLDDLNKIKEVIIKGEYGSEISAFAYYLSEVNMLLQLTPIVKKIMLIDPSMQRYQGKFTLGLIHENSLKLHSDDTKKVIEADTKEEYRSVSTDHEYLIEKPIDEKAEIFAKGY
jgi:hypothetical protein